MPPSEQSRLELLAASRKTGHFGIIVYFSADDDEVSPEEILWKARGAARLIDALYDLHPLIIPTIPPESCQAKGVWLVKISDEPFIEEDRTEAILTKIPKYGGVSVLVTFGAPEDDDEQGLKEIDTLVDLRDDIAETLNLKPQAVAVSAPTEPRSGLFVGKVLDTKAGAV